MIPLDESKELVKLFKPGDRLVVLEGQGHNGISTNRMFKEEIGRLLLPMDQSTGLDFLDSVQGLPIPE